MNRIRNRFRHWEYPASVIASLASAFPILILICSIILFRLTPASAISLWSTKESYLGPGTFFGPGRYMEDQELFEVEIHNMIFVNLVDFVTPFYNNGTEEPNITAEKECPGNVDGRLSDEELINENVDIHSMTIAGMKVLPAVVFGGPHEGRQVTVTLNNGDVVMTMDLAIDFNVGKKGVIKLPFYGTTGSLVVPYPLKGTPSEKCSGGAGSLKSGTTIKGRIGDFNNDGWIDGTLVAVGNFPLESPFFPGEPYALYRTFETDIPIKGAIFGNISGVENNNKKTGPFSSMEIIYPKN